MDVLNELRSVGIGVLWIASGLVELCLGVYFWICLRRMFPVFILYVALCLCSDLMLASILAYDTGEYGVVWVYQSVLIGFGELSIAYEAARRMNQVKAYSPPTFLFVLAFSAAVSLSGVLFLRSRYRWPDELLETVNLAHAGLQAFAGIALWYLWVVPCRKGARWTIQGRQMLMLSAYLLIAGGESFYENHLWSAGRAISGSLVMGTSLVTFIVWSLVISVPRLKLSTRAV